MATEIEVKKEAGVDEAVNGVKKEPVGTGATPATEVAPKKTRKRTYKKKKAAEGGEAKPATPAAEAEGADIQPANVIEHDNTAKIFVGNLSFETAQEEIEEIFGKAGKIANVNIITRGERSLGYGFISYETEDAADQAVELLDKSEIGGRTINVERAAHKDAQASRGRVSRGRGGARGRGGRGYSRGGARAGREEVAARVDGDDAAIKTEAVDEEQTAARGRAGARRGRRASRTLRNAPERSGEASQTTLFVANLPFRVKDEDLLSVFKDYKVLTAHVVTLRSGRSKGFGFIEVANHEEQQKILAELTAVEMEGRQLVIKVAMAHQTAPAEGEAAGASNSTEAQ